MKLSIEERIRKLEPDQSVPGTEICRVWGKIDGFDGLHWCMGIGGLGLPKRFFRGYTIEECLDNAEKEVSTTNKPAFNFKAEAKPFCEHCNEMEIGTLTIYYHGSSYCINCFELAEEIDDSEVNLLLEKERQSKIKAHQKRIEDLSKK